MDGVLPSGAKIPSRREDPEPARTGPPIRRVRPVAVEAVRLLAAEGFVESKSGSGSYVRQRPERQRLTRSWYTSRHGGSPFRAAMSAAGVPGTWESSTERVPMTPAIAARLGAGSGDPAMRTT